MSLDTMYKIFMIRALMFIIRLLYELMTDDFDSGISDDVASEAKEFIVKNMFERAKYLNEQFEQKEVSKN